MAATETFIPTINENSKGYADNIARSNSMHEEVFGKHGDFGRTVKSIDDCPWLNPIKIFTPEHHCVEGSAISVTASTSPDVTPEQVKHAASTLDNTISSYASANVQADLKSMHQALLSGDGNGMASALQDVEKNDPNGIAQFVQEMNRELTQTNASVSMAVDAAGQVVVYSKSGDTALQIDPKSGALSELPIQINGDGSMILEPGEVLNSDTDKLAKSLGNSATNSIDGVHAAVTFDPGSIKWPLKDAAINRNWQYD